VYEQVDVVLSRQKRACGAIEHEVGLHGPLDSLGHLGIGGVNEIAQLAADRVLLVGEQFDVDVDPVVGLITRA
jgi:hypothetical protein